jgi:thiol-disulfide isomerase/thioredoxin
VGAEPLEIVCDPAAMPPVGRKAKITFKGGDPKVEDIHALVATGNEHWEIMRAKLPSDPKQRMQAERAWSFAEIRRDLAQRIRGEERPRVREIGLLVLFSFRAAGTEKDPTFPELAGELLTTIGPSPTWRAYPGSVWNAMEEAGGVESHAEMLELLQAAEPGVASGALVHGLKLARLQEDKKRVARLKKLLRAPELRGTPGQVSSAKRQEEGRSLAMQDVPEFEYAKLDGGGVVTNVDLKDKVVYLEFWATWCKPCVEQMPALHSLHKKYLEQGLHVVSVSVDEEPELARNFRKEHYPMPWLNLHASRLRVAEDFGVTRYPAGFLIASNGKIFGGPLRPADADRWVPRLLKHMANRPRAGR